MILKQEKRQLRLEMLQLMNQHPNWHVEPESEIYKKIRSIGDELSEVTIKDIRIDKNKYKKLRSKKLTLIEIAQQFNISVATLQRWRERNGYDKNK